MEIKPVYFTRSIGNSGNFAIAIFSEEVLYHDFYYTILIETLGLFFINVIIGFWVFRRLLDPLPIHQPDYSGADPGVPGRSVGGY